jgi:hypothetical protein
MITGRVPASFPVRHRFLREDGWLNFGLTGGLLGFVTVSGLVVWLLPFSAFTQVSVVLHTALGLAAAVAFSIWQLSHWLATRNAPRRPRKVAAYVGFWLLAVSCAAGLVIAWQGLFGLYMSHLWARVHLWTGVLALRFLVYHAIPERRGAASAPEFGTGRRRMWQAAAGICVSLLLVSGVATVIAAGTSDSRLWPSTSGENPFAPSYAAVEGGRPLPVAMLANSASCGVSGCHTAIYHEWRASAHRWSAEDQFFQTVRTVMTQLHGRTVTEKCSACHEPVSLLSGHKDPTMGPHAPGYMEGDSCVVCHAVRKTDERGIGSYVLGVPKPYLYELSASPAERMVSHFLMRTYPAQHSRDYSLAPVRRPDSCAPCHKEYDVIVPQQGPVQVETQYDDWKHGKWNTDPEPKQRLYCQQCHMYYLEPAEERMADPYDLRVGLGRKHRNHYFAAANQFMPEALHSPDAAGQIQRVTEWLHGDRKVPEIAKVWPEGPVISVKLGVPASTKAGSPVQVQVVLENHKAGHGFPTGPLNIVRAWLELTVKDGSGQEIFHSGKLDAENHIEAGSYILKPLAIDLDGQMIMESDLWHPEGPQFRPAILAGKSAAYDYRFRVPSGAQGPLAVSARLRYRKANQFFMDSVYPEAHRTAPVTDVSSGKAEIAVTGTEARR